MKKAVSNLVKKVEDSYGEVQFEVLSVCKNADDSYVIVAKEIPKEGDK